MEEIAKIAKAYYANFSDKQKQSVTDLFKAIDTDGNGNISFKEYHEFAKKTLRWTSSAQFFQKLDKDGNGMLDFQEFITMQYLYSTLRIYACDGCKVFLDGAYFTCVSCFNNASGNTFDLCCDCYGYGNRIHHQHSVFLDNYTLLHTMRNTDEGKRGGALQRLAERAYIAIGTTATAIGATATIASLCSIM